jgi:hypothetical protein
VELVVPSSVPLEPLQAALRSLSVLGLPVEVAQSTSVALRRKTSVPPVEQARRFGNPLYGSHQIDAPYSETTSRTTRR